MVDWFFKENKKKITFLLFVDPLAQDWFYVNFFGRIVDLATIWR